MFRIGIVSNRDKDKDMKWTRFLVESILAKGGKALLTSDTAEALNISQEKLTEQELLERSEVIICLGGDGTFLKVAREVCEKNIPMLGINLGSLGFLTEVDKNDIGAAVERILSNAYEVEERMLLEATITGKKDRIIKEIALNDVVITRAYLSRILHLKTYVNDVFIDSFPGDGLIISSPTGSTAYSLSAGGPIVEPDTELIIITPICPHILYSRSFITTGRRVVKVTVDDNYTHDAMVTVDGQRGYKIMGGDTVEIKRAARSIKIIRLNHWNFFNVLQSKIYERGERLRKNEI